MPSMAAAQRIVADLTVRRSLPSSVHGFKLSPSFSRVSASGVFGINRSLQLSKYSVSMCVNESGRGSLGFETDTATRYRENESEVDISETSKPHEAAQPVFDDSVEMDKDVSTDSPVQKKRSAKIHDFCLGIPFGGLVFGAGIISAVFSRNPASLVTGVLFGGAILALSTCSLKIWRQGKSSLPFILGQAAIAAAVLRKHSQLYSLTKNIFPSGFFVVVSAAMICFYSYVLISGGNPPPKKLAAGSST